MMTSNTTSKTDPDTLFTLTAFRAAPMSPGHNAMVRGKDCTDGTHPAILPAAVYSPGLVTERLGEVSPGSSIPSRYHWKSSNPEAVSVTGRLSGMQVEAPYPLGLSTTGAVVNPEKKPAAPTLPLAKVSATRMGLGLATVISPVYPPTL